VRMTGSGWPALPYEEWRETRDTLHMYTQVIGKLRLALSPFEPQWANVALYVTSRGLTTSPMPVGLRTVDAEFDLVDHALVMRASDGQIERRALGGSVDEFYRGVMDMLSRMQLEIPISEVPSEVSHPIPFSDDRTHHVYDPAHAARFFRVLSMIDVVFKQHRAGFRGRTTPVHFFWGSFDLAVTRFSGRSATPPRGADVISRFSADAEEICAGWWPGDERMSQPALYAYASPKPAGIEQAAIDPAGAGWSVEAGEFLLPYEVARSQPDPQQAMLDFLRTSYSRAATLMGWDSHLTEVTAPGEGTS
jgi:Family of unknown function (DUF5996)